MKRILLSVVALIAFPFVALATEGNIVATVAASQTDSVLKAAVSGRRICIYQGHVMVGATATTVTFNSKGAGAGTAISVPYSPGANDGVPFYPSPKPWLCTNRGEALTVTTGAGSSTQYQLFFVLD